MRKQRIKDILASEAGCSDIKVCGWVRTRRDSRDFSFLELNDGSCLRNLQCIVSSGTDAWNALEGVSNGAAVEVCGDLVESPGKGQRWELRAETMTVYGQADPAQYPMQKKRHSDEYLRQVAHLRPRTNKYGSVFRVRSEAAYAIHSFFHAEGFHYVHTPILTGSDCEGAGEMFRVTTLPPFSLRPEGDDPFAKDFFGREAKLTVSGQLEGEAFASALGRIYTFGPTFRAENSNTPRHAAEFWMVEPEMCFADLQDDMDLAEALVRSVTKSVLGSCPDEIGLFDKYVAPGLAERLAVTAEKPFGRISYADAVSLLAGSGRKFEYPVFFGADLQTEHERFLAEEYFKGPVCVYDYPKEIKAFYMRLNDDGRTVAAVDVLVPGIGELIGGSQREERLDLLSSRIADLGQDPRDYSWYLDLRRFGSAPHAGFGLGFERLVMMLTGVTNIRDVLPFPRTVGNLEF